MRGAKGGDAASTESDKAGCEPSGYGPHGGLPCRMACTEWHEMEAWDAGRPPFGSDDGSGTVRGRGGPMSQSGGGWERGRNMDGSPLIRNPIWYLPERTGSAWEHQFQSGHSDFTCNAIASMYGYRLASKGLPARCTVRNPGNQAPCEGFSPGASRPRIAAACQPAVSPEGPPNANLKICESFP